MSSTSDYPYGVWGSSRCDVFAVGDGGTILIFTSYTIIASAGPGGAISPSAEVAVEIGADQTFTITHNTNYRVTHVAIDGVSVGPVRSYTFQNVTANHKISAYFEELSTSPNVVGMSLTEAKKTLDQAHLRIGNVTRIRLPWWKQWMFWLRGTVESQNPRGGTTLPTGSGVDLRVWM